MCQKIIEDRSLAGIANTLTRKHHLQYVNLKLWPKISEKVLELLRINVAIRHRAIPIKLEKGFVTVAIDDATNTENMDELRIILEPNEVIFNLTTEQQMTRALEERYSNKLLGSGT